MFNFKVSDMCVQHLSRSKTRMCPCITEAVNEIKLAATIFSCSLKSFAWNKEFAMIIVWFALCSISLPIAHHDKGKGDIVPKIWIMERKNIIMFIDSCQWFSSKGWNWLGSSLRPRLLMLTILPSRMQVPLLIMAKKMEAATRRRQNTPSMIRSRAWERTWRSLIYGHKQSKNAIARIDIIIGPALFKHQSSTFHWPSSPFVLLTVVTRSLPSSVPLSSLPQPCSQPRKVIWARILARKTVLPLKQCVLFYL